MQTFKFMFTCKRRQKSTVQEETSGIRWHCLFGKRSGVGKSVSKVFREGISI
jgi:hypothetical protein